MSYIETTVQCKRRITAKINVLKARPEKGLPHAEIEISEAWWDDTKKDLTLGELHKHESTLWSKIFSQLKEN